MPLRRRDCEYTVSLQLSGVPEDLDCVCFELNLSCEPQGPEGDHVLTFGCFGNNMLF